MLVSFDPFCRLVISSISIVHLFSLLSWFPLPVSSTNTARVSFSYFLSIRPCQSPSSPIVFRLLTAYLSPASILSPIWLRAPSLPPSILPVHCLDHRRPIDHFTIPLPPCCYSHIASCPHCSKPIPVSPQSCPLNPISLLVSSLTFVSHPCFLCAHYTAFEFPAHLLHLWLLFCMQICCTSRLIP